MTPGYVIGNDLDKHELYILMKESGLRTDAKNPRSTAYGVGQLLLGNRKHYGALLHIDPETNNKEEQIALFRAYVKHRYLNSKNAYQFHVMNGWY